MKAPTSEGVNGKEFLVDIFNKEIFLCSPLKVEEPTSFQDAIDTLNHKEWIDAMKDKMHSMVRNKVWKLVDLPL